MALRFFGTKLYENLLANLITFRTYSFIHNGIKRTEKFMDYGGNNYARMDLIFLFVTKNILYSPCYVKAYFQN